MPTNLALSVKSLTVNFRSRTFSRNRGTVSAVDGVSFEVLRGTTTAIVGETGSGKSTILRAIIGLVPTSSGAIEMNDIDIVTASSMVVRNLRRKIQMVFQDPIGSLNPRMKVETIITEPLVIAKVGTKSERKELVLKILSRVGLKSELLTRYPHQLSGGQRQRVTIARALVLHPEVLLLDEPLSALDVLVQAQVVRLLSEIQSESNLSYVFVTHDLALASEIADNVVILYLGRIVEQGSVEEVFGAAAHPYSQALLSAAPTTDRKLEAHRERIILTGEPPNPFEPPSGCAFRTRCPAVIERCSLERPQLLQISGNHKVACHVVQSHLAKISE
jgi:oligopeptide/dipeptide ABC transporter ATP-binding protein